MTLDNEYPRKRMKITDDEISTVLDLYNLKKTYREIADITHIPYSRVKYIITNRGKDILKSPHYTLGEKREFIKKFHQPGMSAKDMQRAIGDMSFSVGTINKWCKELDIPLVKRTRNKRLVPYVSQVIELLADKNLSHKDIVDRVEGINIKDIEIINQYYAPDDIRYLRRTKSGESIKQVVHAFVPGMSIGDLASATGKAYAYVSSVVASEGLPVVRKTQVGHVSHADKITKIRQAYTPGMTLKDLVYATGLTVPQLRRVLPEMPDITLKRANKNNDTAHAIQGF